MENLKEYKNLYELYRRGLNKRLIALVILFLLFLSSFVAVCADLMFDAAMTVMVITFFSLVAVVVVCIASRVRTSKSLSHFTIAELERIDAQIPSIKMQESIGVTLEAVICCAGGSLILLPTKDVLWVYKEVTTTKYYGLIPVSKFSSLCIVDRNHKRRTFSTKNKTNIVAFLQQELQKYRKGIFYGYSNELYSMFCNDFERMLSMSDEYEKQSESKIR